MSRAALNRLARIEAQLRDQARPWCRLYVLEEREPLPRFGDEHRQVVIRLQGPPPVYTIADP